MAEFCGPAPLIAAWDSQCRATCTSHVGFLDLACKLQLHCAGGLSPLVHAVLSVVCVLADMHVFAKLIQAETCFEVSLTSSTTEADMGQDVNITVTLDDAGCKNRNAAPSEPLDSKVTPQAAAGVAAARPVRKVTC